MRVFVIISKINSTKSMGLYKVEPSYGDLSVLFIVIDIKQKTVSFFQEETCTTLLGTINTGDTMNKFNISKLSKDLVVIIGMQAYKAIKQNSFPDSLSTFR